MKLGTGAPITSRVAAFAVSSIGNGPGTREFVTWKDGGDRQLTTRICGADVLVRPEQLAVAPFEFGASGARAGTFSSSPCSTGVERIQIVSVLASDRRATGSD